jgi:GT2 family glycosyltransferase
MKKEFCNIGILSFNRLNYTKQCIEAIYKTKGSYPFKLTVVDNGSTDGAVDYLKELKSQGLIDNLCLNPKNVGVAKGANSCWTKEPTAKYFLKLDNDMVAQKVGWLDSMIDAMKFCHPQIATLGYNVEPVSYPINYTGAGGEINLRVKQSNIGGACLLIPERTEKLIGYFNENSYQQYGEEDAEYYIRLALLGQYNAYMEDEDVFFHLPAGKAAVIDKTQPGFVAKDGMEEVNESEYRSWKDSLRAINVPKLYENIAKFKADLKTTHMKTTTKVDFKFRWWVK